MKLYETPQAIEKAIKSIANRGKRLDTDIHIAACSIAVHVEKHGDVTLVNRLIDAMPDGSRVNALRQWFDTFTKCQYDMETKVFVYAKKRKTKLEGDDGGKANPWTNFKPEPAYKPMDLIALVKKLVDRADKRVTDGVKESDNIPADVLVALKEIVPTE